MEGNEDFTLVTSDKIDYYMKQGIILHDAKIMAQFSVLLRKDLILANINKNLDENQDDMHWMFHFKISRLGRVIELHIHQAETVFLTFFPKFLCSLDQLEVIRFPNNGIETIPECIASLKSLRILDVSNCGPPNPFIPESIKSFVESLEKFNEFYK